MRVLDRFILVACLGGLSPAACTRATPLPRSVTISPPVGASPAASASPTSSSTASSSTASLQPVRAADGTPTTTALQVFPVVGATLFLATLFLAEGYPSWRIGRLAGDEITWKDLPVSGLPELRAWSAVVGRYPDMLWLRIDEGSQEYYRYDPTAGSWSLDPTLAGGRRTSTELLPWREGKLLAVTTDPESVLGEPAKTTLATLPDGTPPALPPLSRMGVGWTATIAAGELFATYSVPAELAVLAPGRASRFAVPGGADCWVGELAMVSSTEIYLPLSDCALGLVRFDGRSFTSVDVPTRASIADLVAMADGTLWLLDLEGALYRRPTGGDWAPIDSPLLTGRPAALSVSERGTRHWVAVGPEAADGPGQLFTNGEIRLEPGSRSGASGEARRATSSEG